MRLTRHLALFAVMVLGGTSAQAVTIDFTDGTAWSGIGGLSFEALGIRVESISGGGGLTFNPLSSDFGCTGFGLACDGDGIGIGDDEVTGITGELLRVTFLNGPVNILGVDVLDLFTGEGLEGEPERAELSIDDSVWTTYVAVDGAAGGYLSTGFVASGVTELYLRGFTGGDDEWSDVALARIDYAPVPEPATLSLLAAGLLGLGASRRRRRG